MRLVLLLKKTNLTAIFLTGGGDCPDNMIPNVDDLETDRNQTEFGLLDYAIKHKIPINWFLQRLSYDKYLFWRHNY